jgi:hypothetical protein
MAEFKRTPEPERPSAKTSAAESGSILALLIGCIAVLFIIGIRLAYDHAEDTATAANPPALVGSPATQNANASSAKPPSETTGSSAQTETTGSAAPKGGSSNRNSGAAPKDQSVNQNGDQLPASAQKK